MRLKARAVGELGRAAVGAHPVDLVLPPPLAAVPAVDQGIGEVGQVARGLPHRGRREDGRIQADDVVAPLHHRLPPGVLHVAQHVDPERAVVVGRAEAAVDLGRLEDEAAPLAQPDHLLHQVGRATGRVGSNFRVRHRGQWYRLAPDRRSPTGARPRPGPRPCRRAVTALASSRPRTVSTARPSTRSTSPLEIGVVGQAVGRNARRGSQSEGQRLEAPLPVGEHLLASGGGVPDAPTRDT